MTAAAVPTGEGFESAITSTGHADTTATSLRLPGIATAAVCSIGAGAIHAAATGIHAEHPQLARIFVVVAVLQLGAGLLALVRPNRLAALAVAVVNVAAVAGWLATRISGVSFIDGLQAAESPQFADTTCALLGAVAAGAGLAALLAGWHQAQAPRLWLPSLAVVALTVPAMMSGGTHLHAGGTHDAATAGAAHDDHGTAAAAGDGGGDGASGVAATGNTVHGHDTDAAATGDTVHGHDDDDATTASAVWPRPWDPTRPIDLTGVPGVTADQEARALDLVEQTLVDLPRYADTAAAIADGYVSIGDAGTGSEHYIKYSIIQDDVMLDSSAPESLVYNVDGDTRTLAGAMFIASARPTDDPSLTDWAGPLMQWHNHGDLCWDRNGQGVASVVGVVDATGKCARGVNTGGANPMVHVWITPHECGVFAALEGTGAGQAAVPEDQRVDKCGDGHAGHGSAPAAAPVAKPYDPTQPIDLSGTPGVTPEQQAAAENLVAVTVVRLPQWSDYRVAEAAGFQSIGDALTGHEHFINWDWVNDDTILDPDQPESLVYQPMPDGSKQLVSAMYMLPDTVALTDVPDIGGALMQWHIHDNLCFTQGATPKLAGLVNGQGNCRAGLAKFVPSPMIHVWITSHRCGPFAALEGVGAGQVADGEEHLCDHAHGSGF